MASDSPLDALGVLAHQQATIAPGLDHLEMYTLGGLITLLWHGDPTASDVVIMVGGAMGGLLGPADGVYHRLGLALADDGIGTIRLGYRSPGDLERCTHDLAAIADLAARRGARRFVFVGHSFGGAIALRGALMLDGHCAGVVTLSTQSAGCERVEEIRADLPLLLLHGDRDELLPPAVSELVVDLAGHGDLVLLPGTGHLLVEAADEVFARLRAWIPAAFTAAPPAEPPVERASAPTRETP